MRLGSGVTWQSLSAGERAFFVAYLGPDSAFGPGEKKLGMSLSRAILGHYRSRRSEFGAARMLALARWLATSDHERAAYLRGRRDPLTPLRNGSKSGNTQKYLDMMDEDAASAPPDLELSPWLERPPPGALFVIDEPLDARDFVDGKHDEIAAMVERIRTVPSAAGWPELRVWLAARVTDPDAALAEVKERGGWSALFRDRRRQPETVRTVAAATDRAWKAA